MTAWLRRAVHGSRHALPYAYARMHVEFLGGIPSIAPNGINHCIEYERTVCSMTSAQAEDAAARAAHLCSDAAAHASAALQNSPRQPRARHEAHALQCMPTYVSP